MLIGLCGDKQNGKDTVGQFILGYKPELMRYAFADKLKYLLRSSMSAKENIETNKEGDQDFTMTETGVRVAIQAVLGDSLKHFGISLEYAVETFLYTLRHHTKHYKTDEDEHIHFKSSWRKVMQYVGTEWARNCIGASVWVHDMPKDNRVVTDVRRDNEAKVILKAGGIIVNVNDPRKDNTDTHSSEAGISPELITTYIVNDGTLDDLKRVTKNFLDSYEEMLWL